MATRTQAREMVVELLYAYAMGNERIFDFADELLGAKKIRNAQADFAKGLFKGIVAHLQNIDSIIEANLKSWELSRLGVIDKCILRLGVYEILKGEIDAPVAINEAIEIAKILGAENTGKFVNGVLDAIRKGAFDLTKGVESAGNSVLGMQFRTCENFQASTDSSLVESPKIFTNTKATPQFLEFASVAKQPSLPLRFCESQNLGENSTKFAESSLICHSERSEESQKNNKNRDSSLRATRSAQNDNLSKSQNLRKKSQNRLPRFAKGKSSNNKSISKPTNHPKSINPKKSKTQRQKNDK